MTRLAEPAQHDVAHQFGAREARDHWREILDRVEGGVVAVVRRTSPVVLAPRALVADALAELYPFDVKVSVQPDEVAMWLDGVPVHGAGPTYAEAVECFLDALVEYAQDWVADLRHAPNHRRNGGLVAQVIMYADDRDELRTLVFGDE